MLSITAGAQKEMMSFIDQLVWNNIIVEAHEARGPQRAADRPLRLSGLSFRDYRAISKTCRAWWPSRPRKRFKPAETASQDDPGTAPAYRCVSRRNFVEINSLKLGAGRFFTRREPASAPVCVLVKAPMNLLGYDNGWQVRESQRHVAQVVEC